MSETVNQEINTNADEPQTTQQTERTFSQAEVDSIVGERLARERAKYADYASIKEKADKYDAAEEANKSELQKATERADKLQAQIDKYEHDNAVREIRTKVSQETGVPANLLFGDDEETCKKQAENILAFAKPAGYPKVPDGGEPQHRTSGGAAEHFAEWFNQSLKK